MTIGRRGRSEHEWINGPIAQDVAHLAEVVGHEVDGPRSETRSRDVRQEVRHVTHAVAELGMQVGTVVKYVHLMDMDASPVRAVRFDGVHQRDGFAVSDRKDDVRLGADVLDDGIGVLWRRCRRGFIAHRLDPLCEAACAATRWRSAERSSSSSGVCRSNAT